MISAPTFYCPFCRCEILRDSFNEHRDKHRENIFETFPNTVEELEATIFPKSDPLEQMYNNKESNGNET